MHLNKNKDDEKHLLEESKNESVQIGGEPRFPLRQDENGKPAQAGSPEHEDWLEEELQLIAFQMAAVAIVAWKFGLRSRIEIEYVPESPLNEEGLNGWCTDVATFTKKAEEMIRKASEKFEETGECEPLPLGEDPFVLLTDREIASVCIAGRIAEWMLPAHGEAVSAGDVLDSLEYNPLPQSVQQEFEAAFPELLDSPGFEWLVQETMFFLWTDWNLVEGLAEHLIRLFREEGGAVMTDGMFAEVMDEFEAERAEANHPEPKSSEL